MKKKNSKLAYFFFIGSLWNVFIDINKTDDRTDDACNLKTTKPPKKQPRTQQKENESYTQAP